MARQLSLQRRDGARKTRLAPARVRDQAAQPIGIIVARPSPSSRRAMRRAASSKRRSSIARRWTPVGDRLLSLADVAGRYRVSTRTLRRYVAAGGKVAAPCRVRPFRWRESDVSAHIRRLSVSDQLQDEARRTA